MVPFCHEEYELAKNTRFVYLVPLGSKALEIFPTIVFISQSLKTLVVGFCRALMDVYPVRDISEFGRAVEPSVPIVLHLMAVS